MPKIEVLPPSSKTTKGPKVGKPRKEKDPNKACSRKKNAAKLKN